MMSRKCDPKLTPPTMSKINYFFSCNPFMYSQKSGYPLSLSCVTSFMNAHSVDLPKGYKHVPKGLFINYVTQYLTIFNLPPQQ